MGMSKLEIFKQLKILALEVAKCYESMATQEEYKEATGEELQPLVGLLPMMKIMKLQAKELELTALLSEKARDSAKSTDQDINIHKFIIAPDRR